MVGAAAAMVVVKEKKGVECGADGGDKPKLIGGSSRTCLQVARLDEHPPRDTLSRCRQPPFDGNCAPHLGKNHAKIEIEIPTEIC